MSRNSDESWIIEQIREQCSFGDTPLGIGDDGAVPPTGVGELVLSTDTMVEGVHWDHRLDPSDVGWKLMAVNASDLGAMGARPSWAMLNLSLPSPLDREWVRAFVAGLAEGARFFGLPLIGGDTTRSPVRTAALTVGGHARRVVRRSGGRPGDHLWVTGRLGWSAEAFYAGTPSEEARAWFRRPQPPVALGVALAEAGLVTAMMDLSDGLAQDLPRLAAASGCGALVDPEKIPGVARFDWRVAFGEDYQLLLAAPPEGGNAIGWMVERYGIPITLIGQLCPELEVRLEGQPWPISLFDHFPGVSSC